MMNALYITSLVAVGILIVAVAATLLTVTYLLIRARKSLLDVADAITTIADRAEPIGPVVTEINADLTAVRDALEEAVPGDVDEPPATAERTHVAP